MQSFISKAKKIFILGAGSYLAKITGAHDTKSSKGTPQIEVDFEVTLPEGEVRKIKNWYNLIGYQKDEAGEFVEKDGKRLKDKDNTQAALDIFAGMACDSGIEEGEGYTLEDLLDREVGIVVAENEQGNMRVVRSLSPDASELQPAE